MEAIHTKPPPTCHHPTQQKNKLTLIKKNNPCPHHETVEKLPIGPSLVLGVFMVSPSAPVDVLGVLLETVL